MKSQKFALVLAALTLSGTAIAHAEVTEPTVKERVELMGTIRNSFGTIAGMAQGKMAFDAAAAAEAKDALVAAAAMIPEKFETEATDPESTAAPAIWTSWDDFTALATQLEESAVALDASSLDTIKAGFGPVGAACGACHKAYRVK